MSGDVVVPDEWVQAVVACKPYLSEGMARDILVAVVPAIRDSTMDEAAGLVEHLKLGVPDDSPSADVECDAYDHAAAYLRGAVGLGETP